MPKHQTFHVAADHPFDQDLNITGEYSLHRLLDICISRQGSERLKTWLLHTWPDLNKIAQRQNLVRELKNQARFRNKLRLHFHVISEEQFRGDKVRAWLCNSKKSAGILLLFVFGLFLCLLNVSLLLWHLHGGPAVWWYGLLGYAAFVLWNREVWRDLGDDATFLDMEFKQAVTVFRFLEKQSYKNMPKTADLCAPFRDASARPTAHLRNFMVLTIAVGLRMNILTGLALNIFFPYDFLCAFLINRQKHRVRKKFDAWLDIVYELDALNCLAQFADNQKDAVFPTIDASQQSTFLNSSTLGHPLIRTDLRACNDFSIERKGEIVLVTGSNMSGKSTFLRTVGINLVLAYAGAPVIAEHFSTAFFRLFCCIQVNDSLTDGVSQFYQEVKRLKRIHEEMKKTDDLPVLILIDEIFKGTNNRERLIGSRAYIKELTKSHGLAVISTHDIELTQLDDIHNVHFREHVEEGRLVFDYKLHNGPCPTTNALKIMRLEGLPVEDNEREAT